MTNAGIGNLVGDIMLWGIRACIVAVIWMSWMMGRVIRKLDNENRDRKRRQRHAEFVTQANDEWVPEYVIKELEEPELWS